MKYLCASIRQGYIYHSIIFKNKPTIDDINSNCCVTLDKEQYAELIKKGSLKYGAGDWLSLSGIDDEVDNDEVVNYKCSECHNENLFISFSADYLGTVKIGGIDEARKQAKASGINNIMCANCGASIKLHEQAENKKGGNNE